MTESQIWAPSHQVFRHSAPFIHFKHLFSLQRSVPHRYIDIRGNDVHIWSITIRFGSMALRTDFLPHGIKRFALQCATNVFLIRNLDQSVWIQNQSLYTVSGRHQFARTNHITSTALMRNTFAEVLWWYFELRFAHQHMPYHVGRYESIHPLHRVSIHSNPIMRCREHSNYAMQWMTNRDVDDTESLDGFRVWGRREQWRGLIFEFENFERTERRYLSELLWTSYGPLMDVLWTYYHRLCDSLVKIKH